MIAWRVAGSMPFMEDWGGRMVARSTTPGAPFSSRKDTSASPVFREAMASSVSKAGLARKVWAAVRTAF